MTYKEAIGQLMCNNEHDFVNADDLEAFKIAVSVLEKQIPKKPVLRQTPQNAKFKLVEYECPECHTWKPRGTNYCSKCGQALDWSDTE